MTIKAWHTASVRRIGFIVATFLVVFAAMTSTAAAEAPRLNVLMIAVDDLKPALGAYGDPHAVTPNIDRLAARGTVFARAYCQQAVCAPSRVSMLTGLRPDTTRVWDLSTRFRPNLPGVVTLPQAFRQAGWHSVGIGKVFDFRSVDGPNAGDAMSWSEPFLNPDYPSRSTYGFADPATIEKLERRIAELGGPEAMPSRWIPRTRAAFGGRGRPPVERADVPDNAYRDGVLADTAVAKLHELAADRSEPFFLAVGLLKPHLPFNAPERYWAMYDPETLPTPKRDTPPLGAPDYATHRGGEIRSGYNVPPDGPLPAELSRELVHGYYACVSFIDAQVGRLLDAIDEAGVADETIVVFWGDHGFHLGDLGVWCKHTNYEQATRVPLIVVAPDHPGGKVAESPVELVDVYPTLLDLAGVPAPHDLHGVSLRAMLADAQASVKPVAVSQYPRGSRSRNEVRMGYAFRDAHHRLVLWRPFDHRAGVVDDRVETVELYDYRVDPAEARNLAEDPAYADARARLESQAAEYFARFPVEGRWADPREEPVRETP
ncbi:MAG: sulfatase [Planctomycetota bacterium]